MDTLADDFGGGGYALEYELTGLSADMVAAVGMTRREYPLAAPAQLLTPFLLAAQAALLQSVGIGVTNLIFTFVGLWLIDRLGRRTLLYIGSVGYIASLGLCAWAFFTETFSIVPACIFA